MKSPGLTYSLLEYREHQPTLRIPDTLRCVRKYLCNKCMLSFVNFTSPREGWLRFHPAILMYFLSRVTERVSGPVLRNSLNTKHAVGGSCWSLLLLSVLNLKLTPIGGISTSFATPYEAN